MLGGSAVGPGAGPVYLCDGSLAGIYCCVFESFLTHTVPTDICAEGEAEPSLLPHKSIATDPEKARRVRAAIPRKISARALELTENVYLSCLPEKAMAILRFLRLGFEQGARVTDRMGHPDVHTMLGAERHLLREAHLLTGFTRFSDYGGSLVGIITPKNFVLPLLAEHFCDRLSREHFVLFDKTHRAALVYRERQRRILPVESLELNEPDEAEQRFRALWKDFYDTIAIRERINPELRRSHMPKRYWENMLEVRDLL